MYRAQRWCCECYERCGRCSLSVILCCHRSCQATSKGIQKYRRKCAHNGSFISRLILSLSPVPLRTAVYAIYIWWDDGVIDSLYRFCFAACSPQPKQMCSTMGPLNLVTECFVLCAFKCGLQTLSPPSKCESLRKHSHLIERWNNRHAFSMSS